VAVYSVDKLISQARKLAADYRLATGKTLPGVSSEIAEYDACRLLGLTPSPDPGQGYDAQTPGGKRVQIKGRTIFDESKSGQRIGQIKLSQEWDSVVLVLLDQQYEAYEIFAADREELLDYVDRPSLSRKKRGVLSVARFRIIGRLIWTRDEGLIEPVGN
jgi:imidazolonepropionase-like amidohydrolase